MAGDRRIALARSADPATREHVLRRAEEVGDEAAANEAGISRATVRSWRMRAKSSAVPAGSVEGLKAREADARSLEREAQRRADQLLAQSDPNGARAASAVAREAAERAARIGADRRHLVEHEARLATLLLDRQAAEAALVDALVRAFAEAFGLTWTRPLDVLMDLLLAKPASWEGGRPRFRLTDTESEPARDELHRQLGSETPARALGIDGVDEAEVDREVRRAEEREAAEADLPEWRGMEVETP